MMSREDCIAIIPARMESSRLPGKLLKLIGSKSVLLRTYEQVQKSALFNRVVVVCDHERLADEIRDVDGTALYVPKEFESGTDRIADVANQFDEKIIVNVQGDEPFIQQSALSKLLSLFEDEKLEVASLMRPFKDEAEMRTASAVKVFVDQFGRALDFSRDIQAFGRELPENHIIRKHVGVYGFRKEALERFSSLSPSGLELEEKLENLRMIEHNFELYLAEIESESLSIDTQEDLDRANRLIS